MRDFRAMISHAVRTLSPIAVATAIVAFSAGSVAGSRHDGPVVCVAGMCRDHSRPRRRRRLRVRVRDRRSRHGSDCCSPSSPTSAAEAVAAAPDDIAETVETWVAPFPLIVVALADIDPSDSDAFEQAVLAVDTRSSEVARQEVQAWAAFNCDWTSAVAVEQIEAPEPPDCEVLDAEAAAAAAGIDVDVTDLDGSADVSLPGFWTKSCSYGNGAMSLSTLSFNTVEDAERFYANNLELSAGVVLDVAVGSLPDSSLVIQTGVSRTPAPALRGPANRRRRWRPRSRSACSKHRFRSR